MADESSNIGNYDINLDIDFAIAQNYKIVKNGNDKGTLIVEANPETPEFVKSPNQLQPQELVIASSDKCIIQFDSLGDDVLLSSALIDSINQNQGRESYVCLK